MLETRWEFRVVDSRTGKTLESYDIAEHARLACHRANQAEIKNQRDPVYQVVPLSFKK